ncbi:MAG: alpha/beta hydrolase, partial [Halanaerobiales bacterium]
VRIYYETYGDRDGLPLILIHGQGLDHYMFKKQIEKYTNKGIYLITPDMRGHGRSSKVNSLELMDWAEDINDLRYQLGLESTNILGVSMGGVIAQKFAVEYPEKVDKIILSDTFAEINSFTEKLAAYSQVIGFTLFRIFPKQLRAKIVASAYKDYSTDVYEYFKKVTKEADFRQLVLSRKAINKVDLLKELEKIKKPVLVMAGDKILIKPAKKIASSLPNSRLKIIEGSSDPSNMTKPAEFDKNVLEFLLDTKE